MQWKFNAVYRITADFPDPVRKELGLAGPREQTLLLRVQLLSDESGPMFTDLQNRLGFHLSPSLMKIVQPMRKKLLGDWVEAGRAVRL